MQIVNKDEYDFLNEETSKMKNIKDIDADIRQGNMVSKHDASFSENIESRLINGVFQHAEELFYFSPEQRNVFHNYRHALIRAPAGCGTSLMILFKILDLVQNDPEQKVLLVAPYPHDVRCVQTLLTALLFRFTFKNCH